MYLCARNVFKKLSLSKSLYLLPLYLLALVKLSVKFQTLFRYLAHIATAVSNSDFDTLFASLLFNYK